METINHNFVNHAQIEVKSEIDSHEGSDNQTRKKRTKKINKRKKNPSKKTNSDINYTLKVEDTNKINNKDAEDIRESGKLKSKPKIKKSSTKKPKIKSSKKSKDKNKENTDNKEKIKLETSVNQNEKREIKSSSPIEITQIDKNSNSEKPKKKGWWSK